jgi:ring-1,2-phenylacetyl-CoA epoxidase subunit PaaE
MIDACERALHQGGVPADRVHTERFFTPGAPQPTSAPRSIAREHPEQASHTLEVILDGKTHQLPMADGDLVLDVALDAGLDLPYSCKGGVCCTCRARVLEGEVAMDKNYTLEAAEMERGFVLTCQSRPLTKKVVVSYDDR